MSDMLFITVNDVKLEIARWQARNLPILMGFILEAPHVYVEDITEVAGFV